MSQEQRKKYILNYLDKNESISIQNIVKSFNVSDITIRRDLNDLEKQGFLIRTHGGAIKSNITGGMFDFDNKTVQFRNQKIAICKYASHYIEEDDTIYMDCGTTVYYLAKYLSKFHRLRSHYQLITGYFGVIAFPGD